MAKLARVPLLIVLSLLVSVFAGLSTPQVNSAFVGWGIIRIQSINYPGGEVAKTVLVFDEETGSNDFHERSTTWILWYEQNTTSGIPIGRADPDWQLVGTNNVTSWHWRLEKSLDLGYTTFYPTFSFPFENFAIHFYIASDITRSFSVESEIPNLSATITQVSVNYNQTSLTSQPEECPYLMEVTIQVLHDSGYIFIMLLLYALVLVFFGMSILLFNRRNAIGLSNYVTVSSGILVFLPVFYLTFRESLAPNYLTLLDGVFFISMFFYAVFLIGELLSRKTSEYHSSVKYE